MSTQPNTPQADSKKATEATLTNDGVKTEKVYFPASEFLAEMPITLAEQLTALTKKKYSDTFFAGSVSDEQLRGLRVQYLNLLVSNTFTAWQKQVTERREKEQKNKFKELIAAGIDRAKAITISGYDPEN